MHRHKRAVRDQEQAGADLPAILLLRKLQRDALKRVMDDARPDITLTVPTAYGKTLVYTVAAVHEVLRGGRPG